MKYKTNFSILNSVFNILNSNLSASGMIKMGNGCHFDPPKAERLACGRQESLEHNPVISREVLNCPEQLNTTRLAYRQAGIS